MLIQAKHSEIYRSNQNKLLLLFDVTTYKMARKPYKRKIQQDALGKVNRVKEIRRRGKDGLKLTDNSIL